MDRILNRRGLPAETHLRLVRTNERAGSTFEPGDDESTNRRATATREAFVRSVLLFGQMARTAARALRITARTCVRLGGEALRATWQAR